ncbi:MAG: hypothetical protein RLZZ156_1903, partial [Deinococcota bacterium]
MTIHVAIIGAGNIAATHYRGYEKAGAKLIGFVEVNPELRAKREIEWAVSGYATFAQLLENTKPEAVSVC